MPLSYDMTTLATKWSFFGKINRSLGISGSVSRVRWVTLPPRVP